MDCHHKLKAQKESEYLKEIQVDTIQNLVEETVYRFLPFDIATIENGQNFYPPFFTTENLATEQMITDYEKRNGEIARQWKSINGIIAEQVVYYIFQNHLRSVFQHATLFHNIELNGRKISLNALFKLCERSESTESIDVASIKQIQFDFILVVPTENNVVIFPIEVKNNVRENTIAYASKQLRKYELVLQKLTQGLCAIIKPCAISVLRDYSDCDRKWKISEADASIVVGNTSQSDFEEEFWSYFQDCVKTASNQSKENYRNCVGLILALNCFESSKPFFASLGSLSKPMTACINIDKKKYFFNNSILSPAYLLQKLSITLHKQVYLKTFAGKHDAANNCAFVNVSVLKNNLKEIASKFVNYLTEDQAKILNTPIELGSRVVIEGPYGSGKTILLLIKSIELITGIPKFGGKSSDTNSFCKGVIFVAPKTLILRQLKPIIHSHFGNSADSIIEFWDDDKVKNMLLKWENNHADIRVLDHRCVFLDETIACDTDSNYAGLRFRLLKVLAMVTSLFGIWTVFTTAQSSTGDRIRRNMQENVYDSFSFLKILYSLRSTPIIANITTQFWSLKLRNRGLAYGPKIRDISISAEKCDDIYEIVAAIWEEMKLYHDVYQFDYRNIMIICDLSADIIQLIKDCLTLKFLSSITDNAKQIDYALSVHNFNADLVCVNQLDHDSYAGLECSAVILFRRFEADATMAIKRAVLLLSIIRAYKYDIESPLVENIQTELKPLTCAREMKISYAEQITKVSKCPISFKHTLNNILVCMLGGIRRITLFKKQLALETANRQLILELVETIYHNPVSTLFLFHELKLYKESGYFCMIRITIYLANPRSILISRLISFYSGSPYMGTILGSTGWLSHLQNARRGPMEVKIRVTKHLIRHYNRKIGTTMKLLLDLNDECEYLRVAPCYDYLERWLASNESMIWSIVLRKALWARESVGVECKIVFTDAASATLRNNSIVLDINFKLKSKNTKRYRISKQIKRYIAHCKFENSGELGWIKVCTIEKLFSMKHVMLKLNMKIV